MEQEQMDGCSRTLPPARSLEELGLGIVDEFGPILLQQLAEVLTLLAEGRPVPVGDVGDILLQSQEEARAWLVNFGGEFDAAGNLIGLGLTSLPTPHAFRVNGHDFYAWCAVDTLIFPAIIGKTAQVESSDPVSGAKIRLTATPKGAEKLEPSTAVLSRPRCSYSFDIRGTDCSQSHWFASPETAQEYASKNEGVTIHTPEEFNGALNIIAERARGPTKPREGVHAAPDRVSGCLGCGPVQVARTSSGTSEKTRNTIDLGKGQKAYASCGIGSNSRTPLEPSNGRNFEAPPWCYLLWGVPVVLAGAAGRAYQAGVLSLTVTGLIWALSVAWIGSGCFINARSCGRVHCIIDGFVLPPLAVVGVLNALSVVSFGWNLYWLAVDATIAASFVTEFSWKKYLWKPSGHGSEASQGALC